MFYKKRPELIQVLEDLQKSYRSLADKYDQIIRHSSTSAAATCQSHQPLHFSVPTSSSSSNSFKSLRQVHSHPMLINNHPQHDPHHHLSLSNPEPQPPRATNYDDLETETGAADEGQRVKMLRLTEDHVLQQSELIRRNKEKRETIKELCSQINKLVIENQDLKNCLASRDADGDPQAATTLPKPKRSHPQLPSSRFKGTSFFGKLTGCSG